MSHIIQSLHSSHGRSSPQHRDLRCTAELLRKGRACAAAWGAAAAAPGAAANAAAEHGGLQRGGTDIKHGEFMDGLYRVHI